VDVIIHFRTENNMTLVKIGKKRNLEIKKQIICNIINIHQKLIIL